MAPKLVLTKQEAVKQFRREHKGAIPWGDKVWQREAWNNWTDYLFKAGLIGRWQSENWSNPF